MEEKHLGTEEYKISDPIYRSSQNRQKLIYVDRNEKVLALEMGVGDGTDWKEA